MHPHVDGQLDLGKVGPQIGALKGCLSNGRPATPLDDCGYLSRVTAEHDYLASKRQGTAPWNVFHEIFQTSVQSLKIVAMQHRRLISNDQGC